MNVPMTHPLALLFGAFVVVASVIVALVVVLGYRALMRS
jgi:hypothetical protein